MNIYGLERLIDLDYKAISELGYTFDLIDSEIVFAKKDNVNFYVVKEISIDSFYKTQQILKKIHKKYNLLSSNLLLVNDKSYYQIIELLVKEKNENKDLEASNVQLELEKLLLLATSSGASDLHITRGDIVSTIEFRINGELHLQYQMSSSQCDELMFVLYNVQATTKDTTWNRKIPQSANILYTLNSNKFRFRYAHFPIFGETDGCYHCVLRIISANIDEVVNPSLEKTGFSPEELNDVKQMLSNPYGVYIIAGTTGSGKSTTLKTLIEWMKVNRYEDKGCFLTVEDPVEYYIYGTKQSSVIDGSSGAFHSAIKSSLRRDPDVLMIGEVRDELSANALAGAVESGHYCFTTVHAGSVVALLQRLSAFGIGSDKLSTPGFIAGLQCQKLIPIVCQDCCVKKHALIHGRTIEVATKNSSGCESCKFTGIRGRKLIAEHMLPTEDELLAISNNNWFEAYLIWRKKRFIKPGISEGFIIKEKVMVSVLNQQSCYDWFLQEFGEIKLQEFEVIYEKIH